MVLALIWLFICRIRNILQLVINNIGFLFWLCKKQRAHPTEHTEIAVHWSNSACAYIACSKEFQILHEWMGDEFMFWLLANNAVFTQISSNNGFWQICGTFCVNQSLYIL